MSKNTNKTAKKQIKANVKIAKKKSKNAVKKSIDSQAMYPNQLRG